MTHLNLFRNDRTDRDPSELEWRVKIDVQKITLNGTDQPTSDKVAGKRKKR